VRKGGIIAITIDNGDALIEAKLTAGTQTDEHGNLISQGDDVVLITREGMSIRFSESDVRSMGRAATGVRGISLDDKDGVVALAVVVPDYTLLVAGENGIGKRTDFGEYRGALAVKDDDEIMLITVGGQMVRTRVNDVREAGRNTQGVKLIDIDGDDKLQARDLTDATAAGRTADAE
jgi:DNA gyrase subunit A